MRLQGALTELSRSWRAGHALVAVPLVLIAVVMVVDIFFFPWNVHLGPLLVAAPAITASFGGPRLTALIGALAVAAQVFVGFARGGVTTLNHEVQIIALMIISAFVVIYTYLRERRERQLSQVRSVAEAAQRVLLRPLPGVIGPLRVASVYLAAEAEAHIGGDLYAAARTDHTTRLIIGDVRGKGLDSIGDAALLLGAFREAAHRHATLPEVATYLEESVSRDLIELAEEEQDAEEDFVTSVVLDIPDHTPEIRLINLGHPPPLLLRGGEILPLELSRPAPPLGLGGLTEPVYEVGTCHFEPGDLLLLYTDGVIEARGPSGEFYPLVERLKAWNGGGPEHLLQTIRGDLLDFVGGSLGDDAALIAIQRTRRP